MPYIGNTPADKFLTLAKQSFSTSATTSYTLDSAVSSTQDIALFINNVRQSPVDAYTVSGTALTLTSATAGTDEMYCVYLGKTVGTVSPSVNSITNAMMTDDSVGLAELSATGTPSSSNFLRGDNAWAEAGGGKLLQVVRAFGGAELMTSSTYNSTGLYATITPTAATSSLYVTAFTPRIYNNGTQPLYAQIWHGTSGEGSGSACNGLYSGGSGWSGNTHSPSTMIGFLAASAVTTDARTFTVMHKNDNNSSLVGWFESLTGAQGELVIMEFSA